MELPEIIWYFNVELWNRALKEIICFYAAEAVRASTLTKNENKILKSRPSCGTECQAVSVSFEVGFLSARLPNCHVNGCGMSCRLPLQG